MVGFRAEYLQGHMTAWGRKRQFGIFGADIADWPYWIGPTVRYGR